MPKQRIIFTLLYDSGSFMLSRNFRLQRVGNLEWLQRNYDFSRIAFFIDELIVLDVTRGSRDPEAFCQTLKALTKGCFVPIAAGGGVRDITLARQLLRSGADKIVVNTALFEAPDVVMSMVKEFGQQCIVGAVDLKRAQDGAYNVVTRMGANVLPTPPTQALQQVMERHTGELYLNSIDRDGTGQGYDMGILGHLPPDCRLPVILAGGVGNAAHLAAGLADPRVDAAATAHLFNFIGDGLKQARNTLISAGYNLPNWKQLWHY